MFIVSVLDLHWQLGQYFCSNFMQMLTSKQYWHDPSNIISSKRPVVEVECTDEQHWLPLMLVFIPIGWKELLRKSEQHLVEPKYTAHIPCKDVQMLSNVFCNERLTWVGLSYHSTHTTTLHVSRSWTIQQWFNVSHIFLMSKRHCDGCDVLEFFLRFV